MGYELQEETVDGWARRDIFAARADAAWWQEQLRATVGGVYRIVFTRA